MKYKIENAQIHTMESPVVIQGDLLFEDGKILEIAPRIDGAAKIISAKGLHLWPGFIEAHCHLGLCGSGIGFEGEDENEFNDPVTPQLRAIDALNVLDSSVLRAAKGGVTTVAAGPGSANVLGGSFAIYKTYGHGTDDMVLKSTAAIKCAFGENPKQVYRTKSLFSRMTNAAMLRDILFRTKEYLAKKAVAGGDVSKMPPFDMKLEAMIPVVKGEIPLKAHVHQANDIQTAIRIAREFGIRLTLDHCTEGHLIADIVKESGFPVIVGPSFTHPTKFELQNLSFVTAGILQKAGCLTAITTDSPVIPQEYLPLCAGLAEKAGMDPFEALKAITVNPAKILGIDAKVGTLSEGKDADFVLTDGNPLHSETNIVKVFINGNEVN